MNYEFIPEMLYHFGKFNRIFKNKPTFATKEDEFPYIIKSGTYMMETYNVAKWEDFLALNPFNYPEGQIITCYEENPADESFTKVGVGSVDRFGSNVKPKTLNGYAEINKADNSVRKFEGSIEDTADNYNPNEEEQFALPPYDDSIELPSEKNNAPLQHQESDIRYPYYDKNEMQQQSYSTGNPSNIQPIVVSDNEALNSMVQTQINMIKEQYIAHVNQLKEQIDYFKENGNAEAMHLRNKIAEKDNVIHQLNAKVLEQETKNAQIVRYYESTIKTINNDTLDIRLEKEKLAKEAELHERYQGEMQAFQEKTEKEVSGLADNFNTSKLEMVTAISQIAMPLVTQVMDMIKNRGNNQQNYFNPMQQQMPPQYYNPMVNNPAQYFNPQAGMPQTMPNVPNMPSTNQAAFATMPANMNYNQAMANTIHSAQEMQNNQQIMNAPYVDANDGTN